MELQVQIIKRKVKRIRLEFTSSGLKVIVPIGYKGDVNEVLLRHKTWITNRAIKMRSLVADASKLHILDRNEKQLRIVLEKYITDTSSLSNLNPKEIKYRQMRARWGSCSRTGVLTFNKNLRFLPEELIYYVAAHELTHLKHMNHSPIFWQSLSNLNPNYKEHRKQLKLYGFALQK